MSEPLVTPENEQVGAEVKPQLSVVRFEPAPRVESPASAPQAAASPEPEPVVARVGGQEWPLAWLRLVEHEPEPSPAQAPAPAEAAHDEPEPDAHAFGKAMAAALEEGPLSLIDDKLTLFASASAARELVPPSVDEALAAALEAPAFDQLVDVEPVEPAPPRLRPRAVRTPRPRPVPAPPVAAPPVAEPTVEPEASALVTPAYARRVSAARKPAPHEALAPAQPRPVRRPRPQVEPEPSVGAPGEGALAVGVYLLYLAGFLFVPSVLGVITAYRARRDAPEWLQSHYLFQIRTFWIGLTGAVVGAALLFSGVLTPLGLLLGLFLVVWLEIRSALGFIELVKLRTYPRPREWLF